MTWQNYIKKRYTTRRREVFLFRKESFGLAHHFFGHLADVFEEMGHLFGINLGHALPGCPQRGVTQVRETVAHLQERREGCFADALVVGIAGPLGPGAPLVVREGVDRLCRGVYVEAQVVFVLQAGEQGVEVVIAEARIFERVVEVSRCENGFALGLVELEEGEENEKFVCTFSSLLVDPIEEIVKANTDLKD